MTGAPLTDHLRRLVAEAGPLRLDRYMSEALLHPEHGYYTTREPFGCAGDFITAPEISQVFGELIGLWCATLWQQLGSPERIALIELGPGRGTLMADALRGAKVLPGFREALSVHLLEASPRLRAIQKEALAPVRGAVPVDWLEDLDTLPSGPLLILGNEFFDALPIRQLLFRDGHWRERHVGLAEGGSFEWTDLPADMDAAARIPESCGMPSEGDVFEFSEVAHTVMERLATHLAAQGGAGLFLDYGHGTGAYGDSFQALRAHEYADPLEAPGTADLTAHVDFAALLHRAAAMGCEGSGTVGQGPFLSALGISERIAGLERKASAEQARQLRSGARRLIEPTEMGTLFKAIAIAPRGTGQLPGFPPPRGP